MPSHALQQPDLFEVPARTAEDWVDLLIAAFADRSLRTNFLPLAEEAVAAYPGDPVILLSAATAALLDTRPERAKVFLKRFSRRAKGPSEPLLRALVLNQLHQPAAAKILLERHQLTYWPEAIDFFPGGYPQLQWFRRQFDEIMGETPERKRARPKSSRPPRPAPGRRKAGTPPKAQTSPASAEPPPTSPSLARIDIEIPLTVDFDLAPLSDAASREPEAHGRWFGLRERLAYLGLAQGFDELLCLPHLSGFAPLRHQIETVRKVLKQFRGRVLLADEVGLGKTIEAGMVLKEYALRGMAEHILVLTPASLVGQWREELETKFGLAFATTHDDLARDATQAFWDQKRIIASIATARRPEHADSLGKRRFDVVIVDEAHHLRDRSGKSWQLADRLNKRFLMLLTATPVQNDLVELYNLVTLLKPGVFSTLKGFRTAYMTPGKPRQPANSENLRSLMRGIMIRNTRAVVALKLPRRYATTLRVDAAPGEAEAYADLAAAARRMVAAGGTAGDKGRVRLTLHHLLGAAGSSPAAAAAAVTRIAERTSGDPAWGRLARSWTAIDTGGKEAALIELVGKNPTAKKLVFVQTRATLDHLHHRLRTAGISVARFDGSLSGPQKDAAVAEFRDSASILLCTQSGGEGRNIQFCNTLINFDVPWNPMTIEQRIGRIDRIGQTSEVFVFNLVTRGSLEETVLTLLEEKISMFELVVGEVGAILGGLEEEREFPDLVLDAWLEASEAGRGQAFDALGARLDQARLRHVDAKVLDASLFGEDFETV